MSDDDESPTDIAVLLPTIISLILVISSIVMNSLGIHLLKKYGHRLSNQRLIMMNISASELMIALTEIYYWIAEWIGYNEDNSNILRIVNILNAGLFSAFYLLLVSLTIDRLLACQLALRYSFICTQKRLYIVISSIWIVSMLSCIPFFLVDYEYLYTVYYQIIFLTEDGIFLIVATFTYLRIFFQIRKGNRLHDTSTTKSKQSTSNGPTRFNTVTALIVTSFIFLVVIPDVYFTYRYIITDKGGPLEERIIMFVWEINYLFDPAVYIFLQKPLIRGLKKDFQKLTCGLYKYDRERDFNASQSRPAGSVWRTAVGAGSESKTAINVNTNTNVNKML